MYAQSACLFVEDWRRCRLRRLSVEHWRHQWRDHLSIEVHGDGKMKTIAHTDQTGLVRGLNRETCRAARKLHFQVECLCLPLAAI